MNDFSGRVQIVDIIGGMDLDEFGAEFSFSSHYTLVLESRDMRFSLDVGPSDEYKIGDVFTYELRKVKGD